MPVEAPTTAELVVPNPPVPELELELELELLDELEVDETDVAPVLTAELGPVPPAARPTPQG